MRIRLKEIGDLSSYRWFFGNLQINFHCGWNKVHSRSSGSTECGGAAWCSLRNSLKQWHWKVRFVLSYL